MEKNGIYLILAGFVLFWIWGFYDDVPTNCGAKHEFEKEAYQGIIHKKYIDTLNHSYKKIFLNKDLILFSIDATGFCPELYFESQVGDSLVKEPHSAHVKIMTQHGQTFIYEPDFICEMKRN
jgi:hypothetical protein